MRAQVQISGTGYARAHAGRLTLMLLVNCLPPFLALYRLKCILTFHGKLGEPGKYLMGSFYLAPVTGDAALMTGFGDIFLAVFAFLSSGLWPSESRALWYRIIRAMIRWGEPRGDLFLLAYRS